MQSLRDAFAFAFEQFKHNCQDDGLKAVLEQDMSKLAVLPEFSPHLFSTHHTTQSHLTQRERQLALAAFSWLFIIPEMIFWLTCTVLRTLLFTLMLMFALTTAPYFTTIFFYHQLTLPSKDYQNLNEILEPLLSFAIIPFALLRVPYHLLKALLRIPMGIKLALEEKVSNQLIPPISYMHPNGRQINETVTQYLEDNSEEEIPSLLDQNTETSSQSTLENDNANWLERLNLKNVTIPTRYVCPISYELLQQPVLLADGQVYSRLPITHWLKINDKSPCHGNPLITKNAALLNQTRIEEIDAFVLALRAEQHFMKLGYSSKKNQALALAYVFEKEVEEIKSQLRKQWQNPTDKIPSCISDSMLINAWNDFVAIVPHPITLPKYTTRETFVDALKKVDPQGNYDYFMIIALTEAWAAEQGYAKKLAMSWQYVRFNDPRYLECINFLKQPTQLKKTLQSFSNKAMHYTLSLMKDPEKTVDFRQFIEPSTQAIDYLLEQLCLSENNPFIPLWITTLVAAQRLAPYTSSHVSMVPADRLRTSLRPMN